MYDLDDKDIKLMQDDSLVVKVVEMNVSRVRDLIGYEYDDELTNALDNAQGDVFTGNSNHAFVVIKIVR